MITRFIRLAIFIPAVILSSCYTEDPGELQAGEMSFDVTDFDQLRMGDAFKITVRQGDYFEVSASGDRRNIDDLFVEKQGTRLLIRYKVNKNRRHATNIYITMPVLTGVQFSGATESTITGFEDLDHLSIDLSGASISHIRAEASILEASISGASRLSLEGEGANLRARLSGASQLKAYHYPTRDADVNLSGASNANITAAESLKAVATGASVVSYRGNPEIDSSVSGSSTVRKDY